MGDTDLVSNKFPITIDHLNPNSRFSTTFPVVDTTTVNITENGAASLEPNTSYMNAVVQDNSPSGHSGAVLVAFFLSKPATQLHLLPPDDKQVGYSSSAGIAGTTNFQLLNFYLFQLAAYRFTATAISALSA